MRAGQVDRCVDARRHGNRQRAAGLPLCGLQLHQNRGKALREAVVNVPREAVSFLEDGLAPLFAAVDVDQAAVMKRQRRLLRDGFDQRDAPPLALGF